MTIVHRLGYWHFDCRGGGGVRREGIVPSNRRLLTTSRGPYVQSLDWWGVGRGVKKRRGSTFQQASVDPLTRTVRSQFGLVGGGERGKEEKG